MASGWTTKGIVDQLLDTSRAQYVRTLAATGMSEKKRDDFAAGFGDGFRMAVAHLGLMGVIEIRPDPTPDSKGPKPTKKS